MKTKDLFSIILKVFGLLVFKEILFQLPQIVRSILYSIDDRFDAGGIWINTINLLIPGFYLLVAYHLIFKTEKILRWLKFDLDLFEADLSLNISSQNVIQIALVITSGYILIDEIPNLCEHIYEFYEFRQIRMDRPVFPFSKIVVSLSKIIIAFLVISERKKLVVLVQ